MLAVCHDASTVTGFLRRIARPPSVRLVTYTDTERADAQVEHIYAALTATCRELRWDEAAIDTTRLSEYLAGSLAGRLASVFDQVLERHAA
jgi:hypothetical protein